MMRSVQRLGFRKRQLTLGQVLIWIFLSLIFLLVAYPFFYVLSLAVMPYEEYVKRPVHIGPAGFTWFYFAQILNDPRIIRAYESRFSRPSSAPR